MQQLRVLGIFLISFLSVTSAFAQKKFMMGVKFGFNVATQSIRSDFPSGIKPKLGVHFGLLTEVNLSTISPKLGLQSEFMYSNHGYRYNGERHSNLKASFDYVNVPILFKWNFNDNFSIQLGPQFGMLMDHEFEDDRNSVTVIKSDFMVDFTRFETSLATGASWQFYSGVGLYVRYVHGFTAINDEDYLPTTRNRTFQFGVNYRF